MALQRLGPAANSVEALAASNLALPTKAAFVSVRLGEFFVRPPEIDIAYQSRLVLEVTNTASMDHNLQLELRLKGGPIGTGLFGQVKVPSLTWESSPPRTGLLQRPSPQTGGHGPQDRGR